MAVTDQELKLKLLKLLEEDEEFRYAVAGKLGILEILKRLDRIGEELRKLWLKSLEHDKRFEALERKLLEHDKRFDAIERKLLEHDKRFEAHDKRFEAIERKLLEHDEKFEEIKMKLVKHDEKLDEHRRVLREVQVAVGSMGRRMGVDMEKMVLEIYRHALEERGIEPGRVEKFVYRDLEGRYLAKGGTLEIDVCVHNEKLYLLEVKSLVEPDDVYWFYNKALIAQEVLGRKAEKLVMICVHVVKEALEEARRIGVDVIYGAIV